ncbi:MAG: hypothetical protein IK041_02425 [Bacteroidales bacterium]|nr:hypothetical protein [Bacteroidales bacterium]
MNVQEYIQQVFSLGEKSGTVIRSDEGVVEEFNALALKAFEFQREHCAVYREYLELIGKGNFHPASIEEIPFLPIQLFKSRIIYSDPGSQNNGDRGQRATELQKRLENGAFSEESERVRECSLIFTSSATTGMVPSRHLIAEPEIYERSFMEGFRRIYGESGSYNLLALLPSYLERKGSSLVYMADKLIAETKRHGAEGGFFLYDHARLLQTLKALNRNYFQTESHFKEGHIQDNCAQNNYLKCDLPQSSVLKEVSQNGLSNNGFLQEDHLCNVHRKTILLGVSFALLDFAKFVAEQMPDAEERETLFRDVVIIETGGMKGRGEELSREELHKRLREGFVSARIDSEYGMCELLSQAYSGNNHILGDNQILEEGVFLTPPWMRVLARDLQDPFKVFSTPDATPVTCQNEGNQAHNECSFLEEGIQSPNIKRFVEGGLNIIDLANIYSCCFIETEDMGRIFYSSAMNNAFQESIHPPFTVDGRIQNSELRGCNMLIQE